MLAVAESGAQTVFKDISKRESACFYGAVHLIIACRPFCFIVYVNISLYLKLRWIRPGVFTCFFIHSAPWYLS